MNLDLQALATLIAVLECGSLSGAARRERLSVNAVSQRIARLEEQIGAQLLIRTTRLVRATDAGRRVVEKGHVLLAQCADLMASVEPAMSELSGAVRVGLAPDLARAIDWPALQQLMQTHSQLSLEFVARAREVDLVAAGLDLAVWVGLLPERALSVKRIGSLEWHLAASPAYVARCGAPQTPSELAEHECLRVLGPQREVTWELLDASSAVHLVKLGGHFESDSGEMLYHALYAGMGIGIRPAGELATAIHAHTLVRILPKHHLRPMPVALLAPEGRLQLPRVRLIAELLVKMIRKWTRESSSSPHEESP